MMFLKEFSVSLPVPSSVECGRSHSGLDIASVTESTSGEITVVIGLDEDLDDATEMINLVREALKGIDLKL